MSNQQDQTSTSTRVNFGVQSSPDSIATINWLQKFRTLFNQSNQPCFKYMGQHAGTRRSLKLLIHRVNRKSPAIFPRSGINDTLASYSNIEVALEA
ncbi:MAG: hypothetical protein CMQ17_12360 [Gammaproteobacteria bacterium]|nr:hypothetical protein [Gammaproteobacteria bacterium]